MEHVTKIRVRYEETDTMGYVHHSKYIVYYEEARTDAMRAFDLSYKKMEDDGIMLPVIDFSSKFFKPAYYDDLLTVKTKVKSLKGVRLTFGYDIFNEKGVHLNSGETTLVFADKKTGRPIRISEEMRLKFERFIS